MTAGRTPTPFVPQAKPVIDAEALLRDQVAVARDSIEAAAAEHEETLDLGKIIGRIEAAEFFSNICDSVKLSAFELSRKSKAYKNMINPKTKTYFSSCAEFCEVALGATYQRFHQLALNRNAVSQELFEKSVRLGLRQIDYNAIKALPADDQALIQKTIQEAQSREEVLDVLMEMAARGQREKESLTKKLEESEASLAASRQVVGQKESTISKLQESLAASSAKAPTPAFIADAALRDLDNEAQHIAGLIAASLRSYIVKVGDPELALGDVLRRQAIIGACGRVLAAARQVAQDFDVPVSGAEAADGCGEMDAEWAATLRDLAAAEGDGDVAQD